MSITLQLSPDVVKGQISIIRRVMRLPRLTAQEKYQLSELLTTLNQLRNQLNDDNDTEMEGMVP